MCECKAQTLKLDSVPSGGMSQNSSKIFVSRHFEKKTFNKETLSFIILVFSRETTLALFVDISQENFSLISSSTAIQYK